ncbi:hypothetical protein WMC41_11880 [Shinella yambaruensis]|uniref:hypothetical protein n=1 Tax=Shinella yambaruensis TaxID=415996 RepID=UPI003D7BBE39
MEDRTNKARDADKNERTSKPSAVGEDGDVYFFNPWDRHFEAEQKPQTHKFEF